MALACAAPPEAGFVCGFTGAGAGFFAALVVDAGGLAFGAVEDAVVEALLAVLCGSAMGSTMHSYGLLHITHSVET